MPEIGQKIQHSRIIGNLGKGGMGKIYLADDLSLGRKIALKFLPDLFTGDSERMTFYLGKR
jgi:serine/threonine protein kinase